MTTRGSAEAAAAERGAISVEWALGIGVLLLPIALLVVQLPPVLERQSLARVAAQEAGRTVALAPDPYAAGAAAADLVATIAANHGVPADAARLALGGVLDRGGVVEATVVVDVPAVTLPFVGAVGLLQVSATHREPVDRYRSLDPP